MTHPHIEAPQKDGGPCLSPGEGISIDRVLALLTESRVRLNAKDGQLHVRAPKNALTPELRVLLKTFKADLLERVKAKQGEERMAAIRLEPVPRDRPMPLSFAQRRLWFLDRLEGPGPTYNMPHAFGFHGDLDISSLEACLSAIVARHEVLRTCFAQQDGDPVQVIGPPEPMKIPIIDLTRLPASETEGLAATLARMHGRKPFDLETGPLFTSALLAPEAGYRVFLINMHHIIADAWSNARLIEEFAMLYEAELAGAPNPLPKLGIQYADFAYWQRQWLSGEELESQLAYWVRRLEGLPPLLELPTDRPRPPVQSYAGATHGFLLDEAISRKLAELSRVRGVSLFMTLLAAFKVLLARYANRWDVVVGAPTANRGRLELEPLIGFFVNTLALRSRMSPRQSFSSLLTDVRTHTLAAYEHQDVPFEFLLERLQPDRHLSHMPLIQVMFQLRNAPAGDLTVPGIRLRAFPQKRAVAKFDLYLSVTETPSGLSGMFEYATALFDRVRIYRMERHLTCLLKAIAGDPDRGLATLPMLSMGERHALLEAWNDTETNLEPDGQVMALFESQARRTPDGIAVISGTARVTYACLNAEASRIAGFLAKRHGVGEAAVGLWARRSIRSLTGLLGILKAGAAYVPLDPGLPAERLAFIVRDTQIGTVLTDEWEPEKEALAGADCFDVRQALSEKADDARPSRCLGETEASLVFILFTSGSTGVPKGVAMRHSAMTNFMTWHRLVLPLEKGDVTTQFAALSFDASFQEMFSTWQQGGALAILSEAARLDPNLMIRALSRLSARRTILPVVALHQLTEAGAGFRLPKLREIIVSGEQLRVTPHMLRFFSKNPDCVLQNQYGPTESHVVTTAPLPGPRLAESLLPPIGRPIANTRIYVLDGMLAPVPVGVTGELYIAGSSLARGYLARPDVTAIRFIPDPFSKLSGRRMYLSGDAVRPLGDGNLDYQERIDQQVKIRGFRVETGEIEALLVSHPEILKAAVIPQKNRPSQHSLIAYVALDPNAGAGRPTAGKLRAFLGKKLPDYMVPSRFVFLDTFPLTSSGKIDRRSLPQPGATVERQGRYQAPVTLAQELMCAIWAEVLDRDPVGLHDNFFDLGGHSLLATRIVSRIRKVFGVSLSVRAVFEEPTVHGLSARVDSGRWEGFPDPPPIRPIPRDRALPLSFAQRRLWFLDQLTPDSSAYNIPLAERFSQVLGIGFLERSINEIVRRHEALRTRFVEVDQCPVQEILPFEAQVLPVVDLSGFSENQSLQAARSIAAGAAEFRFNLAAGPLTLFRILRLNSANHVLLANMHHIVSDGWSLGILRHETATLYDAYLRGLPSPLPDLPVQYADYAFWQRQWLGSEKLTAELAFWKKRLTPPSEPVAHPTDHPRPAFVSHRGASIGFDLAPSLSAALQSLCRNRGCTPFMLLLAAFKVLLARYSGQEEISVGTVIAGRNHLQLEGLIGFFVNTLVLRTEVVAAETFTALLARVREVALEAHAHQDLPFERLVEELHPERDTSRSPLFQIMFSYFDSATVYRDRIGTEERPTLVGKGFTFTRDTAKFDLTLTVTAYPAHYHFSLIYRTDLFDVTAMQRLARHLKTLFGGVVSNPKAKVSSLPLVGQTERFQTLTEWNQNGHPSLSNRCVHDPITVRACRAADSVSTASHSQFLSFGFVERHARRLASVLRNQGVGPGRRVGLCLPRANLLPLSMLAILKAGGVYVPLDPAHPPRRNAFILRDAGIDAMVAFPDSRGLLPDPGIPLVDPSGLGPDNDPDPQPNTLTPDFPAYIIYTSGSTGTPKGVRIRHDAVVHLLETMMREPGMNERDRLLAVTTVAFDMSVVEIFLPMFSGGGLILAGSEEVRDGHRLARSLERFRITLMQATPATWRLLTGTGWRPLPGMRLISGGEALDWKLAEEMTGGRELWNAFGPTELTVYATMARINRLSRGFDTLTCPIGRPLANTRAYVLDRFFEPVPVGVFGELALGGTGLAEAYHRRPGLTATRFVPHPFAGAGGRLYRTGDRVRFLANGAIDFSGRVDFQIKLRGHRIEPGEIEKALTRRPDIAHAVVMLCQEKLTAYLVPCAGASLSLESIRRYLRERLPEYMVPTACGVLARLPLTPNGKIDRAALARSEVSGPESGAVAPRGPLEEVLISIWKRVLNVETAGVHDNFFASGGHSLLATRLMGRMRRAFGINMDLRVVFERPTVAQLAAFVGGNLGSDGSSAIPPIGEEAGPHLHKIAESELPPLSFAQQRLWLLSKLEPGNQAYNVAIAEQFRQPLSVSVLERVIAAILERHRVLRTRFPSVDGTPVQWIGDRADHSLPVADLAGQAESESQARKLAADHARLVFDLEHAPPLHWFLLRLAPDRYVLLVNMHHILTDGWSMAVLRGEVAALYEAFLLEKPSNLAALPIQFADFARWQRRWLTDDLLETQIAYWRDHLGNDHTPLNLPADRARPALLSNRGDHLGFDLGPELRRSLQGLAVERSVTPFMILAAAFKLLLSKYSGQEPISVGTVISGRNHAEIEGLIGFFVNTLVLRTDCKRTLSFHHFLDRVRETTLGAFANQDVPFERLVELIQPERDTGRTPLFQAMFGYREETESVHRTGPGPGPVSLVGTGFGFENPLAMYELTLTAVNRPSGLGLAFEYMTDLFERSSILAMAGQMVTLLEGIATRPDRNLADYGLLDEKERRLLLTSFRSDREKLEEPLVHRHFENLANIRPDRLAVEAGEEILTYGALERRARALSAHLISLGLGPEVPIGICLERGLDWTLAVMATLKAGCIYVPMDPTYPLDRLRFMARETGMPVILTHSSIDEPLHGMPVRVLHIDRILAPKHEGRTLSRQDLRSGHPPLFASSGAYVIFTSGSSGMPKGTLVSHRALSHFVHGACRVFGIARHDRILQFASPSFDASLEELFSAFVSGATLVLRDETMVSPERLLTRAAALFLSVLDLPTALWHELCARMPNLLELWPDRVGLVIIGGEAARPTALNLWRQCLGNRVRLLNTYGPTEATVTATVQDLTLSADGERAAVSIGRPLPSARVAVADRRLRPLPPAVPGELVLAGPVLATGYLKRSGLTAARFVPNPFTDEPGARLYRTGDLVRFRTDHTLEFLGRIDAQVKIRGYRIEPGEIENRLLEHPSVGGAAVCLDTSEKGEPRLTAFVTPGNRGTPETGELRAWLGKRLPGYMVPTAITAIREFPFTPAGKLDRKALRAIRKTRAPSVRPFLAQTGSHRELIASIWREVLGLERVGESDHFFELGGHSLLATRLFHRFFEAFRISLPLRLIFEKPRLEDLADAVTGLLLRGSGEEMTPPRPRDRSRPAPLSFAQQRLWFLHRLDPDAATYNVPHAQVLEGPFQVEVMENTFYELRKRHESLRTRYPLHGETPVQEVMPPDFTLVVTDLSGLGPGQGFDHSKRLANRAALHRFEPALEPPMLIQALRLAETRHLLLLNIHHLATDGWSSALLRREASALYRAFSMGEPSPLPQPALQYADYAVWQRQWLSGEVLERELAFWRNRLKGATTQLSLPESRHGARAGRDLGRHVHQRLEAELGHDLERLAIDRNCTPFILLVAVYQVMLGRISGQRDFCIGIPVAGRTRPELADLIGFFVNTLVLRANLDGNLRFGAHLERVRDSVLEAQAHMDLPFEKLVEELAPVRVRDHAPFFRVVFNLLQPEEDEGPPDSASPKPGLRWRPAGFDFHVAKFDLGLAVAKRGPFYNLTWTYRTGILEATVVEGLVQAYLQVLRQAVRDPERPVRKLEMNMIGNQATHAPIPPKHRQTRRSGFRNVRVAPVPNVPEQKE